MKIYKFGGASVKNAKHIINVANILKSEGYENVVVVISAMGKMTNAFESMILSYLGNKSDLSTKIKTIEKFHKTILNDLFEKEHEIYTRINMFFGEIAHFFIHNKNKNYDYVYDQIISYGELMSTTIVSAYFSEIGIVNKWIDARKLIRTDTTYRNSKVDWKETSIQIQKEIKDNIHYITQGFIAGASDNVTTTLGREGSDYSAAILAYCLDAESLTIWKDVAGVLNADPRYFSKTTLLNQISYSETLEMAFFGASVIHPKTIKPLENKEIPLYVRSFIDTSVKGTTIKKGISISPLTSCFNIKNNQILLSIAAKDFSFMIEHNISHVFDLFAKYKVSVNLIQNSALSFSVCIEDTYNQFDVLMQEFSNHYRVRYNKNVRLLTIRHFTDDDIKKTKANNKILLSQLTDKTVQFVMH